jgi:hypothetical protein
VLSADELATLGAMLSPDKIAGQRYDDAAMAMLGKR